MKQAHEIKKDSNLEFKLRKEISKRKKDNYNLFLLQENNRDAAR